MSAFVNPWFLAGLAGAAIPIVIHILTRDRVRKVAFSTLRFFVQGARVTLRRKRWAEMLVIALRVLVCVLAALAFARPLLRAGRAAGALSPHARVVVADVSASMARAGGAAGLAAEIRKAASGLPSGAAVGLLAAEQEPRELAPLDGDPRAASAAADAVAPGEGAADLAAALRQAGDALRRVNASHKDIVLVSDLQRSGMEAYRGDWKLAPGIELQPVVLAAAPEAPDLGIADAECPSSLVRDGQPRALTVRVINRGAAEQRDVPVALLLDAREVERQTVRLPAGASMAVRFRRVFDRAGDNPGEIRVLFDDNDPGDNAFRFNVRVIPEIPVLLVAKTAGDRGGALFFLRTALNPGGGSPFAVKAVAADAVRPADVAASSVLVLVDVAALDPAVTAAVGQLLARGGGVLMLPGDGVTPEAFRDAWPAVAPCRLKRVIVRRSAQGAAEGTIARLDFTHPSLEIFQRPHHGDFAAVRFARYWDVTESQASRVLARYDDGRPAMLERQVGQGTCAIWLSPPDPSWNNLPLRAIFLPLLHETVRQSAVRTEWPTLFTVGQSLPVPPGYAFKEPTDSAGDSPAATRGAGFHVLTNAQGQSLCYAINRPLSEAAREVLRPEELKAALERPADAGDDTAPGTGGAAGRGGRELWWWLAVAIVLVLPAELWLANRTARH